MGGNMPEALMQKIIAGDEAAFADLYRQYADQALRVAAAITKDKHSAADAVQETFIRIHHHVDRFDLDKPFKPWLYRILINECNRILKSRGKTVFIQDFLENLAEPAAKDFHGFEEHEALYAAIKQLKDINRVPIVLKYLEGLGESEIAQILNVPQSTVKARLFKGRQRLKKTIEKFEDRGRGGWQAGR
jgi:RNA polymerase sigma factor (sigma-70 family)